MQHALHGAHGVGAVAQHLQLPQVGGRAGEQLLRLHHAAAVEAVDQHDALVVDDARQEVAGHVASLDVHAEAAPDQHVDRHQADRDAALGQDDRDQVAVERIVEVVAVAAQADVLEQKPGQTERVRGVAGNAKVVGNTVEQITDGKRELDPQLEPGKQAQGGFDAGAPALDGPPVAPALAQPRLALAGQNAPQGAVLVGIQLLQVRLGQQLQLGTQLLEGVHHPPAHRHGVIVEQLEQVGNLLAGIAHARHLR